MMDSAFRPKIFAIGDSISLHYDSYLSKMLADKFEYDRKRDVEGEEADKNLDIPQGANGGSSAMVLAYMRFRRQKNPILADVLLLNCGLHDIKTDLVTGAKQITLDDYRQNLRHILNEASLMKLRVIWIRTTPVIDEIHNSRINSFFRFENDVREYNLAADAVMREFGASIIDLHDFSLKLIPESFLDHVHYSDTARKLQAAFIAGSLFAYGASEWDQHI